MRLTGNKVLNEKSEPWVSRARDDFKRDGKPVKRYYRHMYKAGSWNEPQWVVTKVEYNSMGYNVRHIVNSMGCKDTRHLYEYWYCNRGNCELYIKELKNGLSADRMSCGKFSANQLRLFMHAAAYVLLLEAKQILFRKTNLACITIATFREKVILSAVRITEQKTKVKVEFMSDHPIRDKMRAALRRAA